MTKIKKMRKYFCPEKESENNNYCRNWVRVWKEWQYARNGAKRVDQNYNQTDKVKDRGSLNPNRQAKRWEPETTGKSERGTRCPMWAAPWRVRGAGAKNRRNGGKNDRHEKSVHRAWTCPAEQCHRNPSQTNQSPYDEEYFWTVTPKIKTNFSRSSGVYSMQSNIPSNSSTRHLLITTAHMIPLKLGLLSSQNGLFA